MNTQSIAPYTTVQDDTSLASFTYAQRIIDALLARTGESDTTLLPERIYNTDGALNLNLDAQGNAPYDEDATTSIRIFHAKRPRQPVSEYSIEMHTVAKEVASSFTILMTTFGRVIACTLSRVNEYVLRRTDLFQDVSLEVLPTIIESDTRKIPTVTEVGYAQKPETLSETFSSHHIVSENILWEIPSVAYTPLSQHMVHQEAVAEQDTIDIRTTSRVVPSFWRTLVSIFKTVSSGVHTYTQSADAQEVTKNGGDVYKAFQIVTVTLLGRSLTSK
ncbi:MAG: hypothetical protein KBD24_00565 [Candidatus Pacebacteria bacterium]|nr:hypothetical protein [Candidatus Paceibacterota bacterium]